VMNGTGGYGDAGHGRCHWVGQDGKGGARPIIRDLLPNRTAGRGCFLSDVLRHTADRPGTLFCNHPTRRFPPNSNRPFGQSSPGSPPAGATLFENRIPQPNTRRPPSATPRGQGSVRYP
jgi:hypothetical protein